MRLFAAAVLAEAPCTGGGVRNAASSITSSPLGVLTLESPTIQSSGAVISWGVGLSPNPLPIEVLSGVVAVSAATDSSDNLALKADGSVVAWHNDNNIRSSVPPEVQTGIVAIAAGYVYSMALSADGAVIAWAHGELLPVPAEAQHDIIAITTAGSAGAMALTRTEELLSWEVTRGTHLPVPVAAQSNVKAIAGELYYAMVLKTNGSVVAWRIYPLTQLTVPVAARSGVVAIACGSGQFLALKGDGSVVAWNDSGQTAVPAAALSSVVAIADGDFKLALKNDGAVVSWGGVSPDFGGVNFVYEPPVPIAAQSGALAISVSGAHALAVVPISAPKILSPSESQTVNQGENISLNVVAAGYPVSYQWKRNGFDLPGATNSTYAIKYAQVEDSGEYFVQVSSLFGGMAASLQGRLTVSPTPGWAVAWGRNSFENKGIPAGIQGGLLQMSFDGLQIMALKVGGSVIGWAEYPFYSPDLLPRPELIEIPLKARSGVTAIASATAQSGSQKLALKFDGSVVAWENTLVRPFAATEEPVPAAARNGVIAIAAGSGFRLALKADRSVVAWGRNTYGETNVSVGARSGIQAVAAGASHALALTTNGSVLAWGRNFETQTNVPVEAQSDVVAIAAGSTISMALRSDGSVVTWGALRFSQITVPPAARSGVVAIDAGGNNFAALRADGSIVVWGEDIWGPGACCLSSVPSLALRDPTGIIVAGGMVVALQGAVVSLHALSDGDDLILMWPRSTTVGLTLQSTSDLTSPTLWTDVAGAPAISGRQNVRRIPRSENARWYRLR